MQFTMTVHILVEGTEIGASEPVTIYASPTLRKPVIPAMPNFTSVSHRVAENAKISAVVEIKPVAVVMGPEKTAANKYAGCFPTPDTGTGTGTGTCGDTSFNIDSEDSTWNNKYAAVAYMGSVNVSNDDGTVPKYIGKTCPKNHKFLVPSGTDPTLELDSCYSPDRNLTRCQKLVRCAKDEFQTNFGRTQTAQVECETLTQCGASEVEVSPVPETPTTDRLCVERVDRCTVQSGKVGPSDGPCVSVQTCDHPDTEYTEAGATDASQPICVEFSQNCKSDNADQPATEYESQPRTFQQDRVCSKISAECHAVPAVLQTVRDGLDSESKIFPVDFYQHVNGGAPTPTSDRVCTEARVCAIGEVQTASLTHSTDRVCVSAPVRAPDSPVPGPPPAVTPDGTPGLVWGCGVFVAWSVAFVNVNFFGA